MCCCRFGVFRDIGKRQRKRESGVRAVGRHHLRQDVREFRRGAVVSRRKQFSDAAADGQHQQQPGLVVCLLMRQETSRFTRCHILQRSTTSSPLSSSLSLFLSLSRSLEYDLSSQSCYIDIVTTTLLWHYLMPVTFLCYLVTYPADCSAISVS